MERRLAPVERKRTGVEKDVGRQRETFRVTQSLELSPGGNCAAGGLVDEAGRFVWACAPRVDGDPFFSALLAGHDPDADDALGLWAIEMQDQAGVSQAY